MKTLIPLLAMLAVAVGCATKAPDVTTHRDQFTNERADVMEDILLKGPTEPPRELLYLNATRYSKEFSHTPIYLGVIYMARAEVGLLDIEPGQSLIILADGVPYKFVGSGSLNARTVAKRDNKEVVQENAIYEVSPSQLAILSQAKQIKVQVKGKNGLVERELDQEALDRFRRFVSYLAI